MIEEGAKIYESPCCGIKCHSACGIQQIAQQMYHYNVCNCSCGAVLYQHTSHYGESDEDLQAAVDAIRAKPGATDEIKIIKKIITEETKAQKVYKKVLKEKHREFKEAITPHIEAITAIKATVVNTIKQTDEFKTVNRMKTKRTLLENKFTSKHQASRNQMRRILGMARWSRRWYNYHRTTMEFIRRQFRIRL